MDARAPADGKTSLAEGYGSFSTTKERCLSPSQQHPHEIENAAHCLPEGYRANPENPARRSKEASYWCLIRDNGKLRLYISSYLVTHTGEWLTYVASITAIEQIHASRDAVSRTSISILVCLRLLPNVLFTSVGGVIADSYDRRVVMLALDCLGAGVALLFILAYRLQSIGAIYLVNVLQMIVAAVYEPNRSSIVTQLVEDEESLKKANIINGLAWSSMTAVGSFIGGFVAERLGISVCFIVDSITYLMSAYLIWLIRGEYKVSEKSESISSEETSSNLSVQSASFMSLSQFLKMTQEGLSHIHGNDWGAFVLLKMSSALIFGAADVLNVTFSERGSKDDLDGSSERLGLMFAFVGLGCFVAPIVFDRWTTMEDASSLEKSCLVSYLLMGIGCFGMSRARAFAGIYAFTAIRAGGSSVLWIYSSLLLQKLSPAHVLGRVLSVDYALATTAEAISAFGGGILQDDAGMSAEQVSFLMGIVAMMAFVSWSTYLLLVRHRRK